MPLSFTAPMQMFPTPTENSNWLEACQTDGCIVYVQLLQTKRATAKWATEAYKIKKSLIGAEYNIDNKTEPTFSPFADYSGNLYRKTNTDDGQLSQPKCSNSLIMMLQHQWEIFFATTFFKVIFEQ